MIVNVAPAIASVPVPLNCGVLNVPVPPLNFSVAPLAIGNVPLVLVVVMLARFSVPDCTFTVPVLLKTKMAPRVVVPAEDFVSVPALLKLKLLLPPFKASLKSAVMLKFAPASLMIEVTVVVPVPNNVPVAVHCTVP